MTGWFISGSDEDEGSYESDANPAKNEKKIAGLWRENCQKGVKKTLQKVLKKF